MSNPADEPPAWHERLPAILQLLKSGSAELGGLVAAADSGDGYRPWRSFRHHQPLPDELTPEDAWAWVKLSRRGAARDLPLLLDKSGAPFWMCASDPLLAATHRIDTREELWRGLHRAGEGPDSEVSYQLLAAIEEAHHSGAIEGAVTTRRQSRDLIRTDRQPRDRSERMVLNNFRAIRRLDEWADAPLTPGRIVEIQGVVAEGTLDDPEDEGCLRQDDSVHVEDRSTGEVVFVPPPAAELRERLERLCRFANEGGSDDVFVHPVVRAILLHHQLAYDHPFVDGNGRTARTLFMWSILRAGYDWFRSLSLSRAVHRARDRYYRAFLDVQQDEGDVTYFVRQQLRCIEQEIAHLGSFLERRARLSRWLRDVERLSAPLNTRQLALVEHALEHPDETYTAKGHLQVHGVSQPTAWKDLTTLVELGLLAEGPGRRPKTYHPTDRLRELARRRPPRVTPPTEPG